MDRFSWAYNRCSLTNEKGAAACRAIAVHVVDIGVSKIITTLVTAVQIFNFLSNGIIGVCCSWGSWFLLWAAWLVVLPFRALAIVALAAVTAGPFVQAVAVFALVWTALFVRWCWSRYQTEKVESRERDRIRIQQGVSEVMAGLEKLRKTHKLDPTDIEIFHKCDLCRGVFCDLVSPEVGEKLFEVLDAKGVRGTYHECPFEYDGKERPPPLLLVKLIGSFAGVVAAAIPTPEGKAAKAKNNKDRKHYVRGGKFVSLRPVMEDGDYSRVLNLLDEGRLDEAIDNYLDVFGDAPGAEEMGHDLAHARTIRERATRELIRWGLNAGLGDRGFHAIMARHRPEGGVPEGAVPEGQKHPILAIGHSWELNASSERLAMVAQRVVEDCAEAKKLHEERTQEAIAKCRAEKGEEVVKTPEAPAVEVAVSSNAPVVPATVKAPEGPVQSSVAYNPHDWIAAVRFGDGRWMQGYLTKAAGNAVWFVTGRHKILRGNEVVDGFPNKEREDVYVVRPSERFEAVVVQKAGLGDDRVCLRMQRTDHQAINVSPVKCEAKPLVGQTVTAQYYKPLEDKWYTVGGTIRKVRANTVAYAISTEQGCCRMAVFSAVSGKVVAGHYFPEVVEDGVKCTAGFLEDGKIPTKWEPTYVPDKLVPQGEVAQRELGGVVPFKAPFLRREQFKVQGLRKDVDMTYYKPMFHMAKPSTAMLHAELQKFFEPLRCDFNPEDLRLATTAALILDADGSHPARQQVDYADCLQVVRDMDSEITSAGSDCFGGSHREYLLAVGEGDLDLGIEKAAQYLWRIVQVATGAVAPEQDDIDAITRLHIWTVQGKRDGYKYKKLYQGRSIQAPSFTFKALHRLYFFEADKHWVGRGWMMRVGYNMDDPVSEQLTEMYTHAFASLGLDESGFDRYMPAEFMQEYFRFYLPNICPGVPKAILELMESVTIHSYLALTDGVVYQKHRGNPSGYPNTLRLNCVVQLIAWCYAACRRLRELGRPATLEKVVEVFNTHIFLEICGDDSRANVMTYVGAEILDVDNGFRGWLELFQRDLPWDVKIEGAVVFELTEGGHFKETFQERAVKFPPIVARCLVVIDGCLWAPLFDTDRCIRGLMSFGGNLMYGESGREEEKDDELKLAAFMTLRNHVFWHLRGQIWCPTVEHLVKAGWLTDQYRRYVIEGTTAAYRRAWHVNVSC